MKNSDEYVSDFSQMSRQYLPMHSWQEKTFLGNQNNTKWIVILPSFQPVETRISQKSVFADRLWETKKCILRIDKIHHCSELKKGPNKNYTWQVKEVDSRFKPPQVSDMRISILWKKKEKKLESMFSLKPITFGFLSLLINKSHTGVFRRVYSRNWKILFVESRLLS